MDGTMHKTGKSVLMKIEIKHKARSGISPDVYVIPPEHVVCDYFDQGPSIKDPERATRAEHGSKYSINCPSQSRPRDINNWYCKIIVIDIVCYSVCISTAYCITITVKSRKHQSYASLAFLREIHRWPVNSPHKGPVTREMFPFDDVIMWNICLLPSFSLEICCCVVLTNRGQDKRSFCLGHLLQCKNIWILINSVPLKFAPKGLIYKNSQLVQVKGWFRTDNKLLVGPQMV